MSASLTAALIWGVVRSLKTANVLLEPLEELLEDDDEDEVEDVLALADTGPPLIHWPTAPLRLAITPSAGATSVAAVRSRCAVCSAACAPATCAVAASMSDCVAGASVCAAVACCVRSAACACATEF